LTLLFFVSPPTLMHLRPHYFSHPLPLAFLTLMAAFLFFLIGILPFFGRMVSSGWGYAGSVGGCGGWGGGAVLVLARAQRWDAFWVRLLMGSGGGIYVDRELVRRVTKGTKAPLPAAISQSGKVTWRAWPATSLRSQWSSQAIAILHLVLVAVVLCRILGSVGGGGRGWGGLSPSGCLFSLMGPLILMAVRQ
jgi:hypothetical protein